MSNWLDLYLDLAEKAPDPLMKKQIKRAAADEQNHAVWFLYS
jgi:rubrerythrin